MLLKRLNGSGAAVSGFKSHDTIHFLLPEPSLSLVSG